MKPTKGLGIQYRGLVQLFSAQSAAWLWGWLIFPPRRGKLCKCRLLLAENGPKHWCRKLHRKARPQTWEKVQLLRPRQTRVRRVWLCRSLLLVFEALPTSPNDRLPNRTLVPAPCPIRREES